MDAKEIHRAITRHRQAVQRRRANTIAYRTGIVRVGKAKSVAIEGGGYNNLGEFRFVWSDYERWRSKSFGCWYCNSCDQPVSFPVKETVAKENFWL